MRQGTNYVTPTILTHVTGGEIQTPVMGYRQTVRQWTLIPESPGSNPGSPDRCIAAISGYAQPGNK